MPTTRQSYAIQNICVRCSTWNTETHHLVSWTLEIIFILPTIITKECSKSIEHFFDT